MSSLKSPNNPERLEEQELLSLFSGKETEAQRNKTITKVTPLAHPPTNSKSSTEV
jgi:hypothetical protein